MTFKWTRQIGFLSFLGIVAYFSVVLFQVNAYKRDGRDRTGMVVEVTIGPGSKNTYRVTSEKESLFVISYRKLQTGDRVALISMGQNVIVGQKDQSLIKLFFENYDSGRHISVYATLVVLVICVVAVRKQGINQTDQ